MNTGRTVFRSSSISTRTQIPSMRSSLRWRTACSHFLVLGPVLCLAFAQRPSRELARYCHLLACTWQQTLPLWHSWQPLAQYFRRRERKARLAHLCDFAQVLINKSQETLSNESLAVELQNTVYAFDSTTVDLCLSLFPWAQFRRHKSAVKLHTLIDLRGISPASFTLPAVAWPI